MFCLIVSQKFRSLSYVALFALLMFSLSFQDMAGVLLKASTLLNTRHEPYDGLTYPYLYAADWVNLDGTERELAYNEIPSSKKVEPIRYDAFELARPIENLGFSGEDKKIRNAKITYSVPYLGTYKLDGVEGRGSHPAVDIKLPIGTPIVAIGNGVVIKVEDQPWGFGKHIVVKHNDFPDFDNPSTTTTYFSSYSHLDSFSTTLVGSIVRKGQIIATSGNTGTASTPHLHFQIDKASAPWHPYWPFTGDEARQAGLDFFESINSGLGRENAKLHTINPMLYIQSNFKPVSGQIASLPPSELPTIAPISQPVAINPINSTPLLLDPEVKLSTDFVIDAPEVMVIGQSYNLKVKHTASNMIAGLINDSPKVSSNLLAEYTVPKYLDFSSGEVNVPIEPLEVGNMNVTFQAGDVKVTSKNIQVRLYSDVSNDDADLKAIKFLKDKKIMTGFEDGTFKPTDSINKVQAAKLIVESMTNANEIDLIDINFKDVSESDWFYPYVRTLASIGAIDTDREYFEPAKEVNLAEYLKMYFEALQVDVNPEVDTTYASYFNINKWYSKYLQLALKESFVTAEDTKSVEDSLLRRNVARIMAGIVKSY